MPRKVKAIPVRIPGTNVYQRLFIKEHKGEDSDITPEEKTLFITNLGNLTHECVTAAFNTDDNLTSTHADQTKNGLSYIYLGFDRRKALRKSFKMTSIEAEDETVHGLDKVLKTYKARLPDADYAKECVSKYITAFDQQQRELKNQGNIVVDKDGWWKVVKLNKRTERRFAQIKNSKKKTIDNFYTFQQKEKKRQELVDIKTKYEEQKQLIHKFQQEKRNQ
ncbi:hypothetical protein PCE1_000167 [Barthelona sp. PCE]